jgi:hypothetical protein
MLAILRALFVIVGIAAGTWLGWAYLKAHDPEEVYRRRVEAEVAATLAAERFEADVQRRLQQARSTEETREEV